MAISDQQIFDWFLANPNADDATIASTMNQFGLNPADIARATGTDVNNVQSRYDAVTAPAQTYEPSYEYQPEADFSNPYAAPNPFVNSFSPSEPVYGGITSLAPAPTTPPVVQPEGILSGVINPDINNVNVEPTLKSEPAPVKDLPPVAPVISAAPEITYGTDKYTKAQVTDYIGNVMNDATLAPWEKTNKIMESAQKAGVSQDDLKSIYGKDVVDPYLKDYGTGIKSYITTTLSDPNKSDFDKLASINQAATKYGLDTKEIASFSGMNEAGVQKVFDTFDTGLKSIVTNLSAPTVSDIDKTKGALALQSKYGITDDQIANALGGGVTGKDVSAYLAPVKDFAPNFQTITSDNTKTAADIKSFIDDAKKDPRIEGLYGLAIQNAEKMLPVLGLRDSLSGNGTPEQLSKGYTDFVAAVNADPALKTKYGAQADAIQKVVDLSQRIADEQFGGKIQPHMFETFLGLDQKTMADVPKQLEMTASETKTITDSDGQTQTYTVPGTLKDAKGYEPIYTTTGSGEDATQQLTGYTKPVKTAAGVTVDAQYDAQGNLTGYRGREEDKVWPQHRVGITGVWDANGKAMPEQRVETPGFAKGVLQNLADLGPIGQIALMAATGGLGSLAAGALESTLGSTLAKAAGAGLVGGTMAEIGGGKFGKGFLGGSLGSVGSNLISSNIPQIDTGNALADQYLNKALPSLASSSVNALINKQDVGDAALNSLLNTGTSMASNSLINSAMPDTLTPDQQKMFSGISGQLLSSLLQGQTPDIQKAVMGTIMKNAMSSGKDAETATAKGKTMGDDDINFGDLNSGEGAFDISSLLNKGSSGVDLSGLDMGPEAFDISSLLGGGEGIDLSGLDMGPEAFDISSLLGGDGKEIDFSKIIGDDGNPLGIDTTGLDQGDTFDIASLLGSQGDNTQNLTFGDDTEPGSSGGTQGSNGPSGNGGKLVFDDDKEPGSSGGTGGSTGVAKKDDLGSYKGSTYDTSGAKKTTIDDKGNVILPDGTKVTPGGTVIKPETDTTTKKDTKTDTKPAGEKSNTNMLMALLALMAMMNKGGGSSTGSGGTIPSLSANRSQLPYSPPSRPGAGGTTYFSPTTYTKNAAGGGLMGLAAGGMSNLGGYSDGGRLLKGPGDGVSDSIPATIGGKQPARLATGEFVVPARIVSELGNGSTDAGAKRLYAMMDRVQKARRNTKNVAADTKAHKHLPV
jgi:hypothetical protein